MIPCTLCNKTFFCQYDLQRHRVSAHYNHKFECDFASCSKAFKSKLGLKNHKLDHNENYRYLCPQCGKGFNYRTTFDMHINKHDGRKPYKCEKCDNHSRLKPIWPGIWISVESLKRVTSLFLVTNVGRISNVRDTWASTWKVTTMRKSINVPLVDQWTSIVPLYINIKGVWDMNRHKVVVLSRFCFGLCNHSFTFFGFSTKKKTK